MKRVLVAVGGVLLLTACERAQRAYSAYPSRGPVPWARRAANSGELASEFAYSGCRRSPKGRTWVGT